MVPLSFSKNLSSSVSWILVVLLVIANAFLLRQNFAMRAQLDKGQPNTLKAGDKVREFNAQGLHDEFVPVRYTGQGPKRVLLFFTPACPFCKKQFAYWRELVDKLDTSRFALFGAVSQSDDKSNVLAYLRTMGCDSLPLLRMPLNEVTSYKLSRTPITLLISNDGKVEKAWIGLWSPEVAEEAAKTLGVQFDKEATRAAL